MSNLIFTEEDLKSFAGYYYKIETAWPEFSMPEIYKDWLKNIRGKNLHDKLKSDLVNLEYYPYSFL